MGRFRLRFGNSMFGNDWIYQQHGMFVHVHVKSQQWCRDNLPDFIEKLYWPTNNPHLNLLDYLIWQEFTQVVNWNRVKLKKSLIAS